MIVYRELSSVELDLGISAKTLYGLSNNLNNHYRTVKVSKKSGGTRIFQIPDGILKKVQHAICKTLLPLEPVSSYAKAYKPGASVAQNANPHVGKPCILKLDIYRFFDSIRYSTVKEKAFPKSRYAENIRVLLTMLCYFQDGLPQGAPTSPAISNIILYDFDEAVGAYCRQRNLDYTRYCDDMTFSGTIADKQALIHFVEQELQKLGFLLNKRKTKQICAGKSQCVTGVVVNQKLNIADAYKRSIRQEVYYLKQFGVSSHLKKRNSPLSDMQYLHSLYGKINYVLSICPNDANFCKYKQIVQESMKMTKNKKDTER